MSPIAIAPAVCTLCVVVSEPVPPMLRIPAGLNDAGLPSGTSPVSGLVSGPSGTNPVTGFEAASTLHSPARPSPMPDVQTAVPSKAKKAQPRAIGICAVIWALGDRPAARAARRARRGSAYDGKCDHEREPDGRETKALHVPDLPVCLRPTYAASRRSVLPLFADVHEDDVGRRPRRAVVIPAGRVDVALDRLEALGRSRQEHSDVVLAGPEVRAVPVKADQVAGLRLEGDGQVVAARPRVADDGGHVLVVAAADERLRPGRDVGLRDSARAPGDVTAAPPAVDLGDVVRSWRLLREPDELPHHGERLLAEGLRARSLLPLGDPLPLRRRGLREP